MSIVSDILLYQKLASVPALSNLVLLAVLIAGAGVFLWLAI